MVGPYLTLPPHFRFPLRPLTTPTRSEIGGQRSQVPTLPPDSMRKYETGGGGEKSEHVDRRMDAKEDEMKEQTGNRNRWKKKKKRWKKKV